MSGIRGRNTKPEKLLRSALHKLGFRFRLHARKLPGRPDITLSRYRAVVFINGCFWHRHDCYLFRLPATRRGFWETKLRRNFERDMQVREALEEVGWRHLTIWECAFRGRGAKALEKTARQAAFWIRSDRKRGEIRGGQGGAR